MVDHELYVTGFEGQAADRSTANVCQRYRSIDDFVVVELKVLPAIIKAALVIGSFTLQFTQAAVLAHVVIEDESCWIKTGPVKSSKKHSVDVVQLVSFHDPVFHPRAKVSDEWFTHFNSKVVSDPDVVVTITDRNGTFTVSNPFSILVRTYNHVIFKMS